MVEAEAVEWLEETAATAALASAASATARHQLLKHLVTLLNIISSNILPEHAASIANLVIKPTNVSPIAPNLDHSQLNKNNRETPTGVDACERGDSHIISIVYKQ